MPGRIDGFWLVIESIENPERDRCVDLFRRPDGTIGFNVFRRDVEDGGIWTLTHNYSALVFLSKQAAMEAAIKVTSWMKARV